MKVFSSKNLKIFLLLLISILLFSAQNAKAANTYYVAGDIGSDSYTSEQAKNTATPWKTIQKAADTMVAGDTVNVKGGITYNETVTPAASGSSGNYITYQGWSGTGIPTLDGVTDGFVVSSKNYLIFSGFYLIGCAKGFNLSTTDTFIIVRNNIINGCTSNGIDSGASSTNIKIDNNTVYNCADTGVNVVGGSNTEVKNNIITNNTIYGLSKGSGSVTHQYNDVWGNGTNYYNTTAPYPSSISQDPLFTSPSSGNFQLPKNSPAIESGTTLTTVTTDILNIARPQGVAYDMGAYEKELTVSTYYVAGDTGNDNNDGSINSPWQTIQKAADTMTTGDTVNVKGGVTYNENVTTARAGTSENYITFRSWPNTGVPTVQITTMFDITHDYISVSGLRIGAGNEGIRIDWHVKNAFITDNIIIGNRDHHPACIFGYNTNNNCTIYNNTVYNCWMGIYINGGTNNIAKNNLVANNDMGMVGAISSDYNDVWNNTENYASAVPGAHDISLDPLFVDAANGDFHLQASSPAINAGTALAEVTTDILGAGRPQGAGYDIGAYEYYNIPVALTALSPDPNNDNTPTFSGSGLTIAGATLSSVSYSLDNGAWTTTGVTADDGAFDEAAEDFTINIPSVLVDGFHAIRVKSTDSYTNTSNPNDYGIDDFGIDTSCPINGSIQINSNDPIAYSRQLILTISAEDVFSGLFQMLISEDPNFTGAIWEAYQTTKNWTLFSGLGQKTIYVLFKDQLGNTTFAYSDSIACAWASGLGLSPSSPSQSEQAPEIPQPEPQPETPQIPTGKPLVGELTPGILRAQIFELQRQIIQILNRLIQLIQERLS